MPIKKLSRVDIYLFRNTARVPGRWGFRIGESEVPFFPQSTNTSDQALLNVLILNTKRYFAANNTMQRVMVSIRIGSVDYKVAFLFDESPQQWLEKSYAVLSQQRRVGNLRQLQSWQDLCDKFEITSANEPSFEDFAPPMVVPDQRVRPKIYFELAPEFIMY